MIRFALPLVAATALAQPAMAAEIQITAENPVIELTVSESVSLDPDVAVLSAGVTSMAPTAVEAMRQNSAQMERLIERIESLGVDEDDIQTSGVNLNADYQWDEATRQQQFRGYRVSNRVTVRLRDIQQTGEVLDALVVAGANDLGGINWTVDDASAAQAEARANAFATGRERALTYARMSGYSDVRLLEVSESQGRFSPIQTTARVATMDVAENAVPVRPGQVDAAVSITVKYEMLR